MLLGFKDQFVPKILAGEKTHTIRGERKVPISVGDRLDLYKRPRQKGMKLLFRAPCVRIETVLFELKFYEGKTVLARGCYFPAVTIDSISLDDQEMHNLAIRDGFETFGHFWSFWVDRLPFAGQIIYWDYSKRTGKKF